MNRIDRTTFSEIALEKKKKNTDSIQKEKKRKERRQLKMKEKNSVNKREKDERVKSFNSIEFNLSIVHQYRLLYYLNQVVVVEIRYYQHQDPFVYLSVVQ
jgi:hypothetical protein